MRSINIELKKLGDIRPYDNNPRDNRKAVDKVAESIRRYGFKQPIVVDSQGVIVVGHTRYAAAELLGYTEVPCIVSELTDAENAEYRIVDNKTNEYAEWLPDKLLEELKIVDLDGFEFDWGFKMEPEVVEDEVPEADPDPVIQRGDFIKIGGVHRLYCGDSTKVEDVDRLMEGELADLYITDPPYNVDYTGKTKDALKIKNDAMEDGEFKGFLVKSFRAADRALKEGGVFYIWHADIEGYNFRRACKEIGWQVRQSLVWVKNTFVMGRQDYQWRHESCLYGWKEGAAHYYIDDRTQSTLNEEELDFNRLKKEELINLLEHIYNKTTVINEDRPTRSRLHPTMKPIELIARHIINSSRSGQIVLDSFAGSGSTLIACEQLRRKCYSMELDPVYCDVIVRRYIELVGPGTEVLIHRGGKVYSYQDLAGRK